MASGDRPNIARKPPDKKAEKFSQKEQSERFKQTARELEVDETGKAFDGFIGKLLRPKSDSDRSD